MLVRILIMGIFLIMFYGASHVQHLTKIRRIAPKLFVNLVFPLVSATLLPCFILANALF